jgi:hypothetical protein
MAMAQRLSGWSRWVDNTMSAPVSDGTVHGGRSHHHTTTPAAARRAAQETVLPDGTA